MFRKITATLILMAFVAQTFASPFIMLDYFVNTAAYTKNCINKAKPKLYCKGKCQMLKKMQEEGKKEQQNPGQKSEKKDQVLSTKSLLYNIETTPLITEIITDFEKDTPLTDISYAFFHPPRL